MEFVPVSSRNETLDVLRGVAICGMFAVNMTADVFWSDAYSALSPGSADHVSLLLMNVFASGKFITIFSFLFAVGFYIQAERRMAAGKSVPVFWLKRLTGLLMIGLVANALTIPAWILVDYSVFGLGLLLFYRMQPRWILAAAIVLLFVERAFDAIIPMYWQATGTTAPAVSEIAGAIHDLQPYLRRYGSFSEISSTTLLHMFEELTWWRYYLIDLDFFVIMLLGLYVARTGAVRDENVRLALARKTVGWLLGIGIVGAAGWALVSRLSVGDDAAIYVGTARRLLGWPFATSVLGLGYAALIALLMNTDKWRRRLAVFAPVGRLVLTNYLFTGLVLAFVSYQWGLGLYGEVYPFAGLLIVAACLPLQMLASRWWLARFNFGPVEWLWRCWTYGHPPLMRRLEKTAASIHHEKRS